MKENLLSTLMQLLIEVNIDDPLNHIDLIDRLEEAGFTLQDIKQAVAWLQNFAHTAQHRVKAPVRTQRVFALDEQCKLGKKGQNFLLHLENLGIVDSKTREMIIERLMELDTRAINIRQLRWATLMVLSQKATDLGELSWLSAVINHPEHAEVWH